MHTSAETDMNPSSQLNIINATNSNITVDTTNTTDTTSRHIPAPKVLLWRGTTDAFHSSTTVSRQGVCTPGTRTATLNNLESLAKSSDPCSPDVIWMRGAAGAGKSAIMRTLANRLDNQGLLLASFFFFRSETERNTSRPFIPTLALGAWDALPGTQPHIAHTIQDMDDIFSRPVHRQSPHLLERPLLLGLTPADTPLTIIVDGLNECTDEGGQTEIINSMVQLASTIRASAKRRVKIFIASRPEYEIKSRFDELASDPFISIVRLDDTDANIHLFYDEQLDKMRKRFGLPSSWPSQEEIKRLMKKGSGQYAFANVSTRFMHGGDPLHRLRVVIMREEPKDDGHQRSFDALDELYATIFSQIPQDMLLPALFVLRCRLHPQWDRMFNSLLEPFLQCPPGYVRRLSPHLAPLIDFDDNMKPYHASLVDFLDDFSRSGNFSLYMGDWELSHRVQRGMLSMFGGEEASLWSQNDQVNAAFFLHFHWRRGFVDDILVPYPLPITELWSALKRIDLSSLSTRRSRHLLIILPLLQAQLQRQRPYSPVLWFTIYYSLPWRLNSIIDNDSKELRLSTTK